MVRMIFDMAVLIVDSLYSVPLKVVHGSIILRRQPVPRSTVSESAGLWIVSDEAQTKVDLAQSANRFLILR